MRVSVVSETEAIPGNAHAIGQDFEPYPPRMYCRGSPSMRLSTIFLNSPSSHSSSFLLWEGEEVVETALRALTSSRIHFSSSLADSGPIWPLSCSNNGFDGKLERNRVRAGPNSRRVIIITNAGNDIQTLSLSTERQITLQVRRLEGANIGSGVCA
jgi:hypothetical protein